MTPYLRAAWQLLRSCSSPPAPPRTGVKPNPAATALVADNPACLNHTASRIADGAGDCSAFGRSYSGEDIQRTGLPPRMRR